jgi:hypothetical protein
MEGANYAQLCMFHVLSLQTAVNDKPTNVQTCFNYQHQIQQMYIYKFAQSHVILHKHVSVTFVTFIRVLFDKNRVNVQ